MNDVLVNRLLALETAKSFSKASELLFISRPALVQQIRALENELGFPVFERTFEGVTPTKAGKSFLDGLRKISGEYECLVSDCREEAGCRKNQIIIGTLSNFSSILFPAICTEFKKNHPETRLIFRDFTVDGFFDNLISGKMDITVEYMEAYYHNGYPDLEFQNLATADYYCAVPNESPLASKNCIRFSDLHGMKLMMYKKGVSHQDDILRSYMEQNEPEIEIIGIDNYSSSLSDYARLENAAVLLYSCHRTFDGMTVIRTDWGYKIPFGIGYRKNCSSAVKSFLDTARTYCQRRENMPGL